MQHPAAQNIISGQTELVFNESHQIPPCTHILIHTRIVFQFIRPLLCYTIVKNGMFKLCSCRNLVGTETTESHKTMFLMTDEKLRQRQNFSASMIGSCPPLSSPKKGSLRDYFGVDEQVYIMDAKRTGNIGRFLNVSCIHFLLLTIV